VFNPETSSRVTLALLGTVFQTDYQKITTLEDHQATRPPSNKTTRQQDHQTTRPLNNKNTKQQDHQTTRPPDNTILYITL
ncbi:MAG: hypothetical protein MR819_01800, partial [Prevotella sp.]|nr:hypothetical protein [Prevotella sp.]